MRCHMEKLPMRPAVIDSLQWCTQLGTFTNKGHPINISHAARATDSREGNEKEKVQARNQVFHALFDCCLCFTAY